MPNNKKKLYLHVYTNINNIFTKYIMTMRNEGTKIVLLPSAKYNSHQNERKTYIPTHTHLIHTYKHTDVDE